LVPRPQECTSQIVAPALAPSATASSRVRGASASPTTIVGTSGAASRSWSRKACVTPPATCHDDEIEPVASLDLLGIQVTKLDDVD
jgi:hypothetical protein